MIIFDTETTGLSPSKDRICQLSYVKTDDKFNVIYAKNFFFAVDYISEGASEVNGFTVESLRELSGNKTFEDFADEIYRDFAEEKDRLIAHNVSFDFDFLYEEFFRLDMRFRGNGRLFCTMESYTDITQLNFNEYWGTYKWPRLYEVVNFLDLDLSSINKKATAAFEVSDKIDFHDSRFDVMCTLEIAKIYFRDYV